MSGWQIKIGRIFGIEIDLHFSWFVIAALLTTSLAAHLYQVNDEWSAAVVWAAAVVAALAFFAAILLHELSHAAVARARGVKVPSITLFALGGLAHISRDSADARTEFWMSLAGPVTSVLIGVGALGVARFFGWNFSATPDSPAMVMLVWFGFINITLALFNMIPGFPLDGGRVLRAIIWWWTGNQVRATRLAATLGQVVAFAFVFIGFLSFISGGGFGGLWLAFIGWFLSDAARSAAFETTVTEGLRGVRVRDVMSRDCATVERGTSISDVAEEVLRTGRRCFFVVDNGRVAGMVTPQEVRAVPRDRWNVTPAADAMQPLERLHHVEADSPVTEALDVITGKDVNQLPVLDHGQLRGVISRDRILYLLSTRAQLAA
jgi:Zn-dependent protease